MIARLARVAIWISTLASATANAAYSNYNSVLIGLQAAGMGGAYTALYQDSSAVAFYNPAGLAFATDSSASASATVYKKFDTKYGDLDQFTTASLRINQGFFRGVPTASGSVLTYEKLNAAFSIVVPDYETFGGEIRSTANSVSLLNVLDESLWVGGGAGIRLSDLRPELPHDIAVGISLYYTARNLSRTVRERIITNRPRNRSRRDSSSHDRQSQRRIRKTTDQVAHASPWSLHQSVLP